MSLEKKERKEEKKDEKDDQNEIEFQQLVSCIKKALNNEGDLDPLLKIDRVIQLIKDFYKKDEDMRNTNESKEKENKSLIFSALCKKEAKDGDKDSAAVEIKLIIERCKKKTNSKKETKDQGQEGTSIMNSEEETEPPENNPNLMENFETNVKLLKAVFKYHQPLIMCHESINETKKNEKNKIGPEKSIKETIENENKKISAREQYTPIQMLYFIVRTTRNVLSHLPCLFHPTLIRKMHSNITNLYDILGVDLKNKKLQEKLKELYGDNPIDENSYYYFDERVDFKNEIKEPEPVSRDIINREIKSLIVRGHSEGEVKDSNSKFIILFGSLLHHLVGTRDKTNWSKWFYITRYFAGYEIEPLKDGMNEASTADQNNLNITLKRKKIRKNPKYFFIEAIKLIGHWAQMPLRYKDEGGSKIDEIHSALEDDSTTQSEDDSATQSEDLFREIISEKEKQLNDIIKLFESTGKSGSAHKIGSEDIDVFFEQLIKCEKIAYISSADATILSNNSPLISEYQAALEQKLTADFTDSIRLIICPLEVQNQWFLFVADCANNQCSLHGCLGNDSVSAPDVQKLCNTLVSNLKKLPSLKDIPKGKNQPQKNVEDRGSLICSLAFNLVYCLLNLYPKDVPRIIEKLKTMNQENV